MSGSVGGFIGDTMTRWGLNMVPGLADGSPKPPPGPGPAPTPDNSQAELDAAAARQAKARGAEATRFSRAAYNGAGMGSLLSSGSSSSQRLLLGS